MDSKLLGNVIIGINYNFIVTQLRLKLLLIIDVPKVKKLEMCPWSANSKTFQPGRLCALINTKLQQVQSNFGVSVQKRIQPIYGGNHLCNLSLRQNRALMPSPISGYVKHKISNC